MMKKLFLSILMFMGLMSLQAQQKSSVISKVTATWCPNCGTWGWDYFEELKPIYENNPKATILGVHHSGDLRNNVSSWFANNLGFIYQPQFYQNNLDLDVTRNNWMSKVNEMKELVDQNAAATPDIRLGFVNAYIENNRIICNVNLNGSNKSNADYYLAVYIYENNVENFQSSIGMTNHPNVLRDVMATNNFGNPLSVLNPAGQNDISLTFAKEVNNGWNADNLGLLAILWNKDGTKYLVDNSVSVDGIGLLSSNNTLIDSDEISVLTRSQSVTINGDASKSYTYQFFGQNGQLISSSAFTGSVEFEVSNIPSGLYLVHVSRDNKIFTQQVFIAK